MSRDQQPRPFDAIRRELAEPAADNSDHGTFLRLDHTRYSRTGIPEVVYAEYKTTEQVIESLQVLVARTGRGLAARCRPETLDSIRETFASSPVVSIDALSRTARIRAKIEEIPEAGGHIGIIAAGTSDAPVAIEAGVMAEEMGCNVVAVHDVGVAGLHRLVAPLEQMVASGVSCIVVVAGMDGALPSVVAGLVAVPVIGLPTSVGYGYGGGGEAALGAMLQTCVPGLVVVNIDNGIGAGASAALIANRVAATDSGSRVGM